MLWISIRIAFLDIAGDRPQYTNWVPGRMNNFQNHDTEDCVLFLPYKQGQWDDVSCGHSGFLFHHHDHGEIHPYICEYSKLYIIMHVSLVQFHKSIFVLNMSH